MRSKSAEKIKLTSYEDLFGETVQDNGEKVVYIPLDKLHPFKNHPFQVKDDSKMQETVASVEQYGVLVPGIVRPSENGTYEIISGHRRCRACELAGMEDMPVLIRNLNDDEATIIMVDSNIQREDIAPSEKAFAYKMKFEALRHQGSKGEKFTADIVGEKAGESGRTVHRYIRLTELIPGMLEMVDNNMINVGIGERLSYLRKTEQEYLLKLFVERNIRIKKEQAEQLKKLSSKKMLAEEMIDSLLIKKDTSEKKDVLSYKTIGKFFPPEYTKEQITAVVFELLAEWKENKVGEE